MIKRLLIPAVLCAAAAFSLPARAESICADAGATNPIRSQVIAILPAEIQALVPQVDPYEVVAAAVAPVVSVPTLPPEIVTPTVCVPVP